VAINVRFGPRVVIADAKRDMAVTGDQERAANVLGFDRL
jgi:hypothetical protein